MAARGSRHLLGAEFWLERFPSSSEGQRRCQRGCDPLSDLNSRETALLILSWFGHVRAWQSIFEFLIPSHVRCPPDTAASLAHPLGCPDAQGAVLTEGGVRA